MNEQASIPRYRPRGLVTQLFFLNARRRLKRKLIANLSGERGPAHRHGTASRDEYEDYGDREIRNFKAGSCKALVDGRLARIPSEEVRHSYLAPVIETARALTAEIGEPIRILEVGCGNGTNLVILRKALGGSAELSGIDISPSRLEVGRRAWGEALEGVELAAESATDLSRFEDEHFHLVYSVCALEQITYELHDAVSEMSRLASSRVICVEPIPEFGTIEQRLYNIYADQCRTLLPEFDRSGLELERQELIPILHNPLSPVGLLIGRKTGKQTRRPAPRGNDTSQ